MWVQAEQDAATMNVMVQDYIIFCKSYNIKYFTLLYLDNVSQITGGGTEQGGGGENGGGAGSESYIPCCKR